MRKSKGTVIPGRPRVALVGAETLLGRELREIANDRSLPAMIEPVSSEPEGRSLIEVDDEAAVAAPLNAETLEAASVVLLAGPAAATARVEEIVAALSAVPLLIDVSRQGTGPRRLAAPMITPTVPQRSARAVYQIAHPVAVALTAVLDPLASRLDARRAVVHAFEPASERGAAGFDELRKQTTALLTFKPVPKDLFDTQIAFNLTPAYGPDAKVSLGTAERVAAAHLRALLDGRGLDLPVSLRLTPGPVFHGYSLSVWLEFDEPVAPDRVAAALDSPLIDYRGADTDPPSNVGAAGDSTISVGALEPDRVNPSALWLWLSCDNLRLTAENAILLARAGLQSTLERVQ
ncbi:MAG: hypothetical protein FJW40_21970 [Acidobacteria bacterium]|nr:hypothetical protein [Acidobacteriota bacterium]